MSEPAVAVAPLAGRRAGDAAALLSSVGLFRGLGEDDPAGLASAFERVELAPAEVLCRQGTEGSGLYVLIAGEAQVCRGLPGERELELARLGPGEVMGEISLLGGGTRTATVRAVEPCSLLFLRRAEFEARTMSGRPGALELKRRIVAIACARLRRAHAALAATSADAPPGGEATPATRQGTEPLPSRLPSRAYVSRLPFFRRLEPDLFAELLDRGKLLRVARGHVVQQAGTQPGRCYVTLNGAVDDVVRSGGSSLRVGFTGPGHAFGYTGLLDARPASVTSVTRERCLLLAIEPDLFAELHCARGASSRAFAAAIEADLVSGLQSAERTLSHLATARTA